jgi:predicted nucleic acid-binding protein
LWFYEVANVLLGAMRTKRSTAAKVTSFLQQLLTFAITADSESPRRVFPEALALAEAHGLTVYDAAYLELALRKGVPLLTVDRDLKKAARAAGISTSIA